MQRPFFAVTAALATLCACGAKSPLIAPDVSIDAFTDATDTSDVQFLYESCVAVTDDCGPSEICGNGLDDDCNGEVDDGCACEAGNVQPCFPGPPGRRNIGICRDGTQTCDMTGLWGGCMGGIGPQPETCNGSDNLCNGCSQERDCPILCPNPGDARIPDGQPFQAYALRGEQFYMGPAIHWNWNVTGGPCDTMTAHPSFTVQNANSEDASFTPLLSGDYVVTLTVTTPDGMRLTCMWVVHIAGPGVRIEMCYPESTTVDLDLYVHRPRSVEAWYPDANSVFDPNPDSCNWSDCEAVLRTMMGPMVRANWGYANTPLINCQFGPHGSDWAVLGFCSNPRLDIDNNLEKATGVPENINIDDPVDGDTYRVMVQDFTGALAHPIVNVYCSGTRAATYGASPDRVADFVGDSSPAIGAMWRVADVTAHVSAAGQTTCTFVMLNPPGSAHGYWVTYGDPDF